MRIAENLVAMKGGKRNTYYGMNGAEFANDSTVGHIASLRIHITAGTYTFSMQRRSKIATDGGFIRYNIYDGNLNFVRREAILDMVATRTFTENRFIAVSFPIDSGFKLERGNEATLWTPAHADLTPEQIATLPPYGDYKEILPL